MLAGSVSKDRMQAYLDEGLDRFESPDITNADSLRNRVENLAWGLGEQNSWLRYDFKPEDLPTASTKRGPCKNKTTRNARIKALAEEEARSDPATVYYRDIMRCIQLLIGHIPFQGVSDYEPIKLYDGSGARVFNEINSGKWWWRTQQRISAGGTLVPILLASDKTHLTNYSGDKSGWLLYMSIGNIRKDTRRKISNNAWILLGLLPIPPKACGRSFADNLFHTAVDKILAPLKKVNPKGEGIELHCADGHIRRGFPVLAAWIADYPEYSTIMGCTNMWCPCCEIPLKEMGHVQVKSRSYDPQKPYEHWPLRKRTIYEEMLERKAEKGEFRELGIVKARNKLWDYPLCDVYKLWQPDELHVLFIGLVKTLLGDWLIPLLQTKDYYHRFNKRFKAVPRYPQLKRFKKLFHDVQSGSWQGKEMRMMARFLLLVTAPILHQEWKRHKTTAAKFGSKAARSSIQRVQADSRIRELEHITQCIRALSTLVVLVSQRSHSAGQNPQKGAPDSWGSLEYLDEAIQNFQTYKSIFKDQKMTEARKEVYEAALRDLRATHAAKYSLPQNQRWRTKRDQEIAEATAQSTAGIFVSLKVHMIQHITESIKAMGTADNYTTDISELLHKNYLKTGYRASNKIDFEKQILWYNDRVTNLAYMDQTLQYLALKGYYVHDSAFVLRLLDPEEKVKFSRQAILRRAAAKTQSIPDACATPSVEKSGYSIEHCGRWPYPPPAEKPPIPSIKEHTKENVPPTQVYGEVKGAKGLVTLNFAENQLHYPGITRRFRELLIEDWTPDIFDRIYPSHLSLKDFGELVKIRLYNAVKCWKYDFHPPHDVSHDILKCFALPGEQKDDWGNPQIFWAEGLVNADGVEGTFGDKRICYPHLYFGYTAPANVFLHESEDPFDSKFHLTTKWDAGYHRNKRVPQMMGFAFVDVASYSAVASTPEAFHGMVHIKRQKEAKMVICTESIHRAAHAMLLDESVRDPESAEYVVNNFIDGYHYWSFY